MNDAGDPRAAAAAMDEFAELGAVGMPGMTVWQWAWPPVQVAIGDAAEHGGYRNVYAAVKRAT